MYSISWNSQSFGHLMRRADSFEKTLMLGKIEGGRRRGRQRMRWLDGITNSGHEFEQTLGDSEGQGSLARCSPWVAKSQTWLSNWAKNCTRPPEILGPQWAGQLLLLLGNQTSPRGVKRKANGGGLGVSLQRLPRWLGHHWFVYANSGEQFA